MEESESAITRQSSRRFQWKRQSSEARHSFTSGLKLSKNTDSAESAESPPEALSFVTFKDGRHKIAQENNGQDFV